MHIVLDLQACQSPESGRRGIGRYSLSLAKAMAASPRGHRITVLLNSAMGERIEYLRAQFSEYLPASEVLVWRGLAPTAFVRVENSFRRRASEILRRQALRALAPDIVHVASVFEGVGDDVVSSLPTQDGYLNVVTLYDLIPLVHRQTYLADPGIRSWYMERLEQFRNARQMLGISQFSCDEARQLLSVPAECVTNILGAADNIFHKQEISLRQRNELFARYGIVRSFVMYAGGFDSRKNIGSLIRAFARLPTGLRRLHQLVIVGQAPEPERQALEGLAKQVGLDQDEYVFAGFVPDADLVKLYNLCRLYAFPSLQEGFGLPALEAMASGAVVIGSNTSSLPEVIGMADALFDPTSPAELSAKLEFALTDEGFRQRFLEQATAQVAKFSWQETSRRALDGMEAAYEREKAPRRGVWPVSAAAAERVGAIVVPPTSWELPAHVEAVPAGNDSTEGRIASGDSAAGRQRWDRLVVALADNANGAAAILAARDMPADVAIAGDVTLGHAWSELAARDRPLLHELLYRHGGYPLVKAARDADYASAVLGDVLPVGALESVGRFQVVPADVAGQAFPAGWRDSIRGAAEEIRSDAPARSRASEADWASFATAWTANSRLATPHTRWFIDITNLAIRDAGTGIQRVVRHLLDELMQNAPESVRIEPVSLGDDGVFRHARSYCAARYFGQDDLPADDPVEFHAGDVYLGLDLVAHLVPAHIDRFRRLRDLGVQQHYVVYDLLPLLRPDCFEPHLLPLFRAWYEAIAEVADGVLCISRAVADEFEAWLHQARPHRERPLNIGWFHLGADMDNSLAAQSALDSGHQELVALGDRPTLLMVGTIEPRKGHAQTLAAFELLWARGIEANLVIVGRPGWLMESMVEQLRRHPMRGRRLFWFEHASDALLLEAYQRASALLMSSEGEGYGLPLIEAARHGLPLIVRDLPVFREIVAGHAHYFSGFQPEPLADAIETWLQLHAAGAAPSSAGIAWLTWTQSRDQLVDTLQSGRWTHQWRRQPAHRFAATDYRLLSEVGKLERGQLISSGRAGTLFYGPYVRLEAGSYTLEVHGSGEAIGWMDVCSRQGTQVHATLPFKLTDPGREPGVLLRFDFSLAHDVPDLELRFHIEAPSRVAISALQLSPMAEDRHA